MPAVRRSPSASHSSQRSAAVPEGQPRKRLPYPSVARTSSLPFSASWARRTALILAFCAPLRGSVPGTMEKDHHMPRTHIAIIGAPLDLGQDRRGVDMGPSAVRVANLHARVASLGYEVEDWGNIPVEQKEAWPEGDPRAKYLALIASTCEVLATRVGEALRDGLLPLVLGGDHSVAVGTVSGVSNHFRARHETAGLIWLDAHADMNTPQSSPSGNIHGMPLACILGAGPGQRQHPRHAAGLHSGRRPRPARR